MPTAFHLPTSRDELRTLDWREVDVLLVTGDAHVDHPSFPAALLGRWLLAEGFRVGVIARPDPRDPADISRLGRPRLFVGITAGALDSMVANYTASKRRRSDDPYAPGGWAGGRPDRALTVYGNLARRAFGKEVVIVAGGLEASLRRFAHYDYWSDGVRRPVLMDCGADLLVHGMGERPILEIARRLAELEARGVGSRARRLEALAHIAGLVWREPGSRPAPAAGRELPPAEDVAASPRAQASAFRLQERHRRQRQWQASGGMRVIANPPPAPLTEAEIDRLYGLPFSRDVHPIHGGARVPALEQVRFSVASHRGCFGGCAFCAIAAHQGTTIQSRSAASVLAEVEAITRHPGFRGTVSDVGGPTANMYGLGCARDEPCDRPSCLWPKRCRHLVTDASRYLDLLARAAALPGVRHLFVTTGIRMDLALADQRLLARLAAEHTSGLLKVAPEHLTARVLALMRKPEGADLDRFLEAFRRHTRAAGKDQYLLPYFIAAHPGCRLEDMLDVALWLERTGTRVEQVQLFTPTPGTAATVMYATGLDPANGRPVFVEREPRRRELHKALLLWRRADQQHRVREALALLGREDLAAVLRSGRRRAAAKGTGRRR